MAVEKIRAMCERISNDGNFRLSEEEFAALVEIARPNAITDAMVDRALDAWFSGSQSETDSALRNSMRAALQAAFL